MKKAVTNPVLIAGNLHEFELSELIEGLKDLNILSEERKPLCIMPEIFLETIGDQRRDAGCPYVISSGLKPDMIEKLFVTIDVTRRPEENIVHIAFNVRGDYPKGVNVICCANITSVLSTIRSLPKPAAQMVA